MTINETNPHYKFAQYWEAIGRPPLEGFIEGDSALIFGEPSWFTDMNYRIKGDRHWQLRKEWVDSGYELPIEYFSETADEWVRLYYLTPDTTQWIQYFEYRKAEPKQEEKMTDKLPELVKGKKLELIDVPISTLTECLSALSDGHVLQSEKRFHFLEDNAFVFVDKNSNVRIIDDFVFQPFIAAYKLVDAPWWENIPDGGVLCEYARGAFGVVVNVYKNEDGNIFAFLSHGSTQHFISDFTPVTDQWLESMKRGF